MAKHTRHKTERILRPAPVSYTHLDVYKRQQVYNENLHRKRVPRSEEDLNLLLMRSTRAIKVDRPGVYLLSLIHI